MTWSSGQTCFEAVTYKKKISYSICLELPLAVYFKISGFPFSRAFPTNLFIENP